MTFDELRAALDRFPWARWNADLRKTLEAAYVDILNTEGPKAAGDAWRPDDPFLRRFTSQYLGQRITQLDETTRAALIEDLRAAIDAGAESVTALRDVVLDSVRTRYEGYEEWRALRIARSETAIAYNQADVMGYAQAGVSMVHVLDGTLDDICREANGQEWTLVEALTEATGHPNCLPGDMIVAAAYNSDGRTFERAFDGELVVLRTAANHLLACTPNHPVLTRQGWRAACTLRQGDDVIGSGQTERIPAVLPIGPDNDQVIAPIEQIARAARVSLGVRAATMPTAPEDFHGDGSGGDVYVERPFGLRQLDGQAASHQPSRELSFIQAYVQLQTFARLRSCLKFLVRTLHPAYGCVRCVRHRRALLGAPLLVAKDLRFAPGARDAEITRPPAYLTRHAIEALGDFARAQVLHEVQAAKDFIRWALDRFSWMTERAAHGVEQPIERRVADPEGGRQLWDVLARFISPTRVLNVNGVSFHGHVFNLQSATGWYAANGIVTHNCSRAFSPAEPGESIAPRERFMLAEDLIDATAALAALHAEMLVEDPTPWLREPDE